MAMMFNGGGILPPIEVAMPPPDPLLGNIAVKLRDYRCMPPLDFEPTTQTFFCAPLTPAMMKPIQMMVADSLLQRFRFEPIAPRTLGNILGHDVGFRAELSRGSRPQVCLEFGVYPGVPHA